MRRYIYGLLVFLMLSCKNKPHSSGVTEIQEPNYRELGMTYAQGTQKVLGKNLLGTIQNKGVAAAVTFCNERAYPLTDSMATQYKAKIKRVSDKPRNPKNMANTVELAYINVFKEKVAKGDSIEPMIKEEEGKWNFYYPIITNNLCLNCHGMPEKAIAPDVMAQLYQLYPQDKATGYDVDEVRGLWSIVFETEIPE